MIICGLVKRNYSQTLPLENRPEISIIGDQLLVSILESRATDNSFHKQNFYKGKGKLGKLLQE